ncbi:MAG: ABC transporter substrate-binding protein [Bifidobacteriaceae bacterium]|jgi:iron complex transport system substrate-binding protein|nr:ABC transporter substrate-binding protein [Bifidobacteriaceae bacterium]
MNSPRFAKRSALTLFIASATLVTLATAGCSSGSTESPAQETSPEVSTDVSAGAKTGFPLTLTNCGIDVTYENPPERVVALDQMAAEILIKLGVGDRLIGVGYQPDAIPEEIAVEYKAVPTISDPGDIPSHEAVLEAQPDFVYTMYTRFFTAENAGEREELHNLGVATYLTELTCAYGEAVEDVSFEMLFQEYQDLGAIFGVDEAAAAFAAEQRAILEAGVASAATVEGTPSVMWFYSTYDGVPVVAGPGLLPQHVTELVGAENVFDDAASTWPETSWEEVAARSPDVIILADLSRGLPGDSAADKIEILKADPVTSQLEAVKQDRFIVVPGRYMEPSYATVNVVPVVADGLVALF